MLNLTVNTAGFYMARLMKAKSKAALRALDERTRQVAKRVYDNSQQLVPVDTGSLKKSGIINKLGFASYQISYGGRIENPKTGRLVDYHWFVEFRTAFLSTAYIMEMPQFREAIMQEFRFGAMASAVSGMSD